MNQNRLEELMKAPIEDRIIPNDEETKKLVLQKINETAELMDFETYIESMSKGDFYNQYDINSQYIIETYKECPKMMLFYCSGSIRIIPIFYLRIFDIDTFPTKNQVWKMRRFYDEHYAIDILDKTLPQYKLDLERGSTWGELAYYGWVKDEEFCESKNNFIKYLKENNCKTYTDFTNLYNKYYSVPRGGITIES